MTNSTRSRHGFVALLVTAVVLSGTAQAQLRPSNEVIWPPLGYDREQVEVLARSITFAGVLNQGELIISLEYPNATVLCLDAAFYAGRVQGLIWAMDRDTVMEHGLQWTIDNAKDLFDTCLSILLREDVPSQNANDKNQVEDVKEILSGQIRLIQQKLTYARDVKIKADKGLGCVPSTRVPNNRLATEVFGADPPTGIPPESSFGQQSGSHSQYSHR
jgi:hypothetical protein